MGEFNILPSLKGDLVTVSFPLPQPFQGPGSCQGRQEVCGDGRAKGDEGKTFVGN